MILNTLMLYINLYKHLFINFDVTAVEVNSNARLARLPLMPEVTYLIKHPIPYTSMHKIFEIVAYPTFLSNLSDKSLPSSGHSRDYHVIEFESFT